MKNYEKIILLLEQEGVDISPFINLKKNEIATKGCIEVLSLNNYQEIIEDEQHLHETVQDYNNPFILSLSKNEFRYVGDLIVNDENGEGITIEELFKDENRTERDKHTITYASFRRLSSEYRAFIKTVVTLDKDTVKQYKKTHKHVLEQDLRKLITKHIKLFWFIGLVLMLINFIFVRGSQLVEYQFFKLFYNIVLNLLLVVPFLKIWYHHLLLNKLISEDKEYNKFKEKCDELTKVSELAISRLEKDIYDYSNRKNKKISKRFLNRSRRKMIRIRSLVKSILKHQNRQKPIMFILIKILNKGVLLSVLFLLILLFILI